MNGLNLARLHDESAVGEMAYLAEPAQTRNVMLVQLWKHLVAACFENCLILSHDRKRTKSLPRPSSLNLGEVRALFSR